MQWASQEKYLGLLMVITRSKKEVFGYVRDRIKSKLENWKERLLSSAGREVLLKAIIMAIPIYLMSPRIYAKLSVPL